MAANSGMEYVFSAGEGSGREETAGAAVSAFGPDGGVDAGTDGFWGAGALTLDSEALDGLGAAAAVDGFLGVAALGAFPSSRTIFEPSWLGGIIHALPSFLAFSLPSRMSLEMVAAGIPVALAN